MYMIHEHVTIVAVIHYTVRPSKCDWFNYNTIVPYQRWKNPHSYNHNIHKLILGKWNIKLKINTASKDIEPWSGRHMLFEFCRWNRYYWIPLIPCAQWWHINWNRLILSQLKPCTATNVNYSFQLQLNVFQKDYFDKIHLYLMLN